jgi:hypothetical protein
MPFFSAPIRVHYVAVVMKLTLTTPVALPDEGVPTRPASAS